MKKDDFLKSFINDLQDTVGPLYYEEEDLNEDVVRLELEDVPYVMVELETSLNYMNIYRVFSYQDFPRHIRENLGDKEEIEELEQDIFTYYVQNDYVKFFQQAQIDVDIHTDDCWGCPCYDTYVGLTQVPCDVISAKEFVELTRKFDTSLLPYSFKEYRKRKLDEVLKHNRLDGTSSDFSIREKENIDYRPMDTERTVFYFGWEYILFKSEGINAAITKEYYDIFMRILDEVEYFSDFTVTVTPTHVRFTTCSFYIDIIRSDDAFAVKTESVFFNLELSKISLFLSEDDREKLAKTIKYDNEEIIQKMQAPHIYTEGQTDCMHIKHAFELSAFVRNNYWLFDEHIVQNKGDKELLNWCRTYCKKGDAYHATIAIFDRDGSVNINDIEDEKKGYKVWGNRVYSLALPLPKHRNSTPKISIEHYYSDDEILQEYEINGIKRRLYMGKEFDEIGRAPDLGKMTKNYNKCGKDNINIIDSDVYDFNSSLKTNYALSKMLFAQKICESVNISIEATNAFNMLFLKILEILKYDSEQLI